ncbi:protein translocase subunit SecD [Vibrio sp. SM6]|uniref:Protein translocase subunit SecD n=1 Tax=Vibrio agarilyticus TaxID=2726741 RepID=A0A7X8TNZ5_9VIBR|nr:protein translocase subunit SecD [Vibrio agarilyticus]NLS12124.1 protein translocase subunit SecD [Vibrio agarilyticus]
MKKIIKKTKVINRYSMWQYLVLVTTVAILALSALPTWYGEKPAIQIQSESTLNASIEPLMIYQQLEKAHVPVYEIKRVGDSVTVIFSDEADQARARDHLATLLPQDTEMTYAFLSMAPDWLTRLGLMPVKLGLDLRGGVQFLLNVDVDMAFHAQATAMSEDLRLYFREARIRGVKVNVLPSGDIRVSGSNDAIASQLNQYLSQYSHWQVDQESNHWRLSVQETYQQQFVNEVIKQNTKIMRERIEELGITEASVQRQGSHAIRIELPGVQDPAQAKQVIGATASLAFYSVEAGGSLVLPSNEGGNVELARRPVLGGEHIVDAHSGVDEMGNAVVNIVLDSQGGAMMSDYSRQHIGKPMATVYREYHTNAFGNTSQSEQVISVATIQSQLGSRFQISGVGSMQEAQSLALLLRAGSLTAPVTIVEERTIGASLGEENIANGFAALVLGVGLTLLFMALWYRRLGWVANLALCTNMLCLLGLIALLPGAVLTLPGMAGLVLTVGMAVDTNVIIFERIKDKMQEGRSFAAAIDCGFDSAFATILDANITTMITAVVLYTLGNGPIQGFALTLGLGLLTSMFTGIFVSRAIINLIWGQDNRRNVRV